MSKRNNQRTVETAPAGDAVTAAIDETRGKLQALQQERADNRAAYLAAREARNIAKMRELNAKNVQLTADITVLGEVLDADEEVLRDIQHDEMTEERAEFIRFSVGAVAQEHKAMREAYAETMRAIFTAAHFYRRVQSARSRAREHVRSLRDPRLLELYETVLGYGDVMPLDHLVRSILTASKGTDLMAVDHLKVPIAEWLKRASATEQLHLSELEMGQARSFDVLARVLPDNSPEAA